MPERERCTYQEWVATENRAAECGRPAVVQVTVTAGPGIGEPETSHLCQAHLEADERAQSAYTRRYDVLPKLPHAMTLKQYAAAHRRDLQAEYGTAMTELRELYSDGYYFGDHLAYLKDRLYDGILPHWTTWQDLPDINRHYLMRATPALRSNVLTRRLVTLGQSVSGRSADRPSERVSVTVYGR